MNQPTTITIAVDFMQLIGALAGLMVFVLGVVYGFGKLLVHQFELRLEERFTTRDRSLIDIQDKICRVETHGQTLERDLMRLRAELPTEYVRREDWIRFSGTIDAKLDWLRDKSESTAQFVVQIIERLK